MNVDQALCKEKVIIPIGSCLIPSLPPNGWLSTETQMCPRFALIWVHRQFQLSPPISVDYIDGPATTIFDWGITYESLLIMFEINEIDPAMDCRFSEE